MIEIFCTDDCQTTRVEDIGPGTWVKLTSPSLDEFERVADALDGVDLDDLMAANDPEEKTRVQHEDGYSLVLIDVPTRELRNDVEGPDCL